MQFRTSLSVLSRLFVLPLVLGGGAVAAQPATAPPDTARSYRHHLGLTASPQLDQFFTANRSLPIGLLYRHQTRPNRAWRVRVVGQSRYFKQEAPLFIGTAYTERTVRLEAAVGLERWYTLSRRVTLFAGLELGGKYNGYRRDYKVYQIGYPVNGIGVPPNTFTTAVSDGVERRPEIGGFIQPMAGLRYFFSKRLYAEMETSAEFYWSQAKFKLNGTFYDLNTSLSLGTGARGDNTYYTFSTRLRPVNSVRLFFLF